MMKKLIILAALVLMTSCGKMKHEFGDLEITVDMPSDFTFGPNFQAWLDYCRGRVEHRNISQNLHLTEEELVFETRECYYESVGIGAPEIPDEDPCRGRRCDD